MSVNKPSHLINAVAVAISLCCLSVAPAPAYALTKAQILDNCSPLLDAANSALAARKAKAAVQAKAITGGGDVSANACIDSLRKIQTPDAFLKIPSLSSVVSSGIQKVRDEFQSGLMNMVCDFTQDLKDNADQFLSCSAAFSVGVTGGVTQNMDLQSCLGTGLNGTNISFSKSIGEGDTFKSRLSENASTNPGINDSAAGTGSKPGGASGANSLMNSVKEKINGLNELRGETR